MNHFRRTPKRNTAKMVTKLNVKLTFHVQIEGKTKLENEIAKELPIDRKTETEFSVQTINLLNAKIINGSINNHQLLPYIVKWNFI